MPFEKEKKEKKEEKILTEYSGLGEFFYEPDWLDGVEAERALTFFYHMSLCALNTALVSGAMAERCTTSYSTTSYSTTSSFRVNFKAFLLYSLANVVVYALPACWVWNDQGFLRQLGAVDNAGWVDGKYVPNV